MMTARRTLPWLQDTAAERVWGRWEVAYRDVRILDAQNRLHGVFNLSSFDLGIGSNYQTLRGMFLAAAKAADTDADSLPDDWEQKNFQGLLSNPLQDSDADGSDNFTEFALGTNPADWLSKPVLNTSFNQNRFQVRFRRWGGGLINYVVEVSPDLQTWSSARTSIRTVAAPQNLYDGQGNSEVTYLLGPSSTNQPVGFVRVRAAPRPSP